MGTEYKAEFAGTAPTGKPSAEVVGSGAPEYQQVTDPNGASPTGKPSAKQVGTRPADKDGSGYIQESAGTLPNGGKVNLWDK